MQEASLKMDALANKLGKWDPLATIREFRDANFTDTRDSKPARRFRKLTNEHP
jgi:hypothetical protein